MTKRSWSSAIAVLIVLGMSSSVQSAAAQATCEYVAHRGYAGTGATENGMPAFKAAVAAGATWLETDLRGTATGSIALMHDPTVDRTTDGTGEVAALSSLDIRALHLDDGSAVPFLNRFVRYVANSGVSAMIEIKRFDTVDEYQRLFRRIDHYGVADRVVISSFDRDILLQVKTYGRGIPRVLIETQRTTAAEIHTYGSRIALNQFAVTAAYVSRMASHGIGVYAWTVDDPADWPRLVRIGVMGTVTDEAAAYSDYQAAGCPTA